MTDPNNADRAEWARSAIEHFTSITTSHGEEPDVMAADLVCDILHYMRREHGVTDLKSWLNNRLSCHDEEVREAQSDV